MVYLYIFWKDLNIDLVQLCFMRKLSLTFIILCLMFSNFNYVGATVAPSPYSMVDYSDQSGSVDLSTGDMALSIPTISVPGIDGGLSYDVSLNYKSGITVDEVPSQVGLGWNLNLPTISRVVQGVPDDYSGETDNLHVYEKGTIKALYSESVKRKDWSSFFLSMGRTLLYAALPGGSFAEFGIQVGMSLPSFATGVPTYYEQVVNAEEYSTTDHYYSSNGFFYLSQDPYSNSPDNNDYYLEINNPDMFYVNSPVYSGALTYSKYSPFDGTVSAPDSYLCMLPTESVGVSFDGTSEISPASDNYCDNPLSVRFISSQGDGFNKVELVDMNGYKYIFEPIVKVLESHTKETISPANTFVITRNNCYDLFNYKKDFNYREADLLEEYVTTWGITRIESTRNSNDYVEFSYSGWVQRESSSPAVSDGSDSVCQVTPDGRVVYSKVVTQTRNLEKIKTPTHFAQFNYGPEEVTGYGTDLLSGPNLKRLNSIGLYYRGNDLSSPSDDKRVSKFNFNYNEDGNLRGDDTLTLSSVYSCGLNDGSCYPKTKFEYGFNPSWYSPDSFGYYRNWDRWRYYYPAADYFHRLNLNENPGRNSSAWSLTKVYWPTGGSTEWNYESNEFTHIGQRVAGYSPDGAPEVKYGDGIRVNTVTNCDGNELCYNLSYDYETFSSSVNSLPGIYVGSSVIDDTYAQVGGADSNIIYGDVKVIPGNILGNNGYTEYTFTNAMDFPDKGGYRPPVMFTQQVGSGSSANYYTFGFSVPQNWDAHYDDSYELPTGPLQPFLLIGPAGDRITFYMGAAATGTYISNRYSDCVKTINMPTDVSQDGCDFTGLNYPGASNLVCKTVILDRCDRVSTHVYQKWNGGIFDNSGQDHYWIDETDNYYPIMISNSATNNHPETNDNRNLVFPFKYVPTQNNAWDYEDMYIYGDSDDYDDGGIPQSYFWNDGLGACYDKNQDRICDIAQLPRNLQYNFGGISFSKFRGLLLQKTIYDADGNIVAYTKNEYPALNGEFDLNGEGYFGYPVDSYRFVSGPDGNIPIFPVSSWFTLSNVTNYLDGKKSVTSFEYSPNGLTNKIIETNIDYSGDEQIRLNEVNYAIGENDCSTPTDYSLSGGFSGGGSSDSAGYHVYNQVVSSSIKDGISNSDYISSSKTILDSNNKCYTKESSVWSFDDPVYGTQGRPDSTEYLVKAKYFDHFGSSSTGGDYDRVTVIKDANENSVTSFYKGIGIDQCSGESGPRLTCEKDAMGNQMEYYYDEYGRLDESKDTNGVSTYYHYDDLNRLFRITNSVGNSEVSTEYNFGLNNCDSLEEGNENCMNWVKTRTRINDNLESVGVSYVDGLGRSMQSSVIKDDSSAIVIDTFYNDLGLVSEISEPYEHSSSVAGKLLSDAGIVNEEDYLLSYHLDQRNAKDDSENSIKMFYYDDPLTRIWKTFPLSEYSPGNEYLDCGDGAVCTNYLYDSYGEPTPDSLMRSPPPHVSEICYGPECDDIVGGSGGGGDDSSTACGRSPVRGICVDFAVFHPVDRYEVRCGIDLGCSGVEPKCFVSPDDLSICGSTGGTLGGCYCIGDGVCDIQSGEISGVSPYDCDVTLASEDYSYSIVVDAEGKSTKSTIDKFGNIVNVRNAKNNVSEFEYDVLGNLLRVVSDFNGRLDTLVNQYNVLGQLIHTSDINAGDTTYTYDNVSNVKTITDSNNDITEFFYDELNRLVYTEINGEKTSESYYDVDSEGSSCVNGGTSIGFLCEIKDYVHSTSELYKYNLKGNLISSTSKVGVNEFINYYDYDDAGNVVKIKLPNNDIVEYGYNKLNQLETVSINGVAQDFVFDYNNLGMIDQINYPDGSLQDFSYNDRNWLSKIEVKDRNSVPTFVEEYRSYDNVGNLLTVNDLISGGSATFDYDNLYRLQSFTNNDYYDEPSVGFTGLNGIVYQYDFVGNRITQSVNGNGQDIVHSVPGYVYGNDDKLDSADGCTYIYSNIGALTSKTCPEGTTSYSYDVNNRLIKIEMYNDDVLEFGYDALGRRVWKSYLASGETEEVYTMYIYGIGSNPNIVVEPYYCVGDIFQEGSSNGIVDLSDVSLFSSQFGIGAGEYCDLFEDGVCDLSDLALFSRTFNLNTEQCVKGVTASEKAQLDRQGCLAVCNSKNTNALNLGLCNCGKPGRDNNVVQVER